MMSTEWSWIGHNSISQNIALFVHSPYIPDGVLAGFKLFVKIKSIFKG